MMMRFEILNSVSFFSDIFSDNQSFLDLKKVTFSFISTNSQTIVDILGMTFKKTGITAINTEIIENINIDAETIVGVLGIALTAGILGILLIVSILHIKRKKKDMEIPSLLNPERELSECEKKVIELNKRRKDYNLFEKLEYQYQYNSPFPDNLKIPYNSFDGSSPGHLTFFDLWELKRLIQTKAYPLSEFLFSFPPSGGVQFYKKNTTQCPPAG